MNQPRNRLVALLIFGCCVALVATAVFSGMTSVPEARSWRDIEEVGLTSLNQAPASRTLQAGRVVNRYPCPRCGTNVDWGSSVCARCGWCLSPSARQVALPCVKGGALGLGSPDVSAARIDQALDMLPVAGGTGTDLIPPKQTAPETSANSGLLSPRDQDAAGKEMIEGHWLGLEVIPLSPELAKEYQIPKGETGVLVDEITLEAAESGILAGDMVQAIDGRPTSDLRAFFLATQHVQEKERASIAVSRRGEKMSFEIKARNTKILGFAQMEAAQPIQPGALSPHRSRGKACTYCHLIMATGGQLPTDAGDILPAPPAITKNAKPPHGERGRCAACHVVR